MSAIEFMPRERFVDDVHRRPEDRLVLLDPGVPARRERWERVLAWYGWGERRGHAARTKGPDHVVIAVGSDVALVARPFARRAERPFITVSSAAEVLSAVPAGARSVLVVADRMTASIRALDTWRTMTVPWGIITGVDLPGIAFALAKAELAHDGAHRAWGFVDANAGRHGFFAEHPNGEPRREPSVEDVLSSDLDVLTLVAHGEGAHANLNSVVLCGRVGDRERISSQSRVAGCLETTSGPRCKRVPGGGKPIVTFSRVLAKTLVLASCNGFATADELYPSDASAVLSAIDGHVSTIVTSDRSVRLFRWLSELAMSLLATKGDAYHLVEALDDVTLRDQHERAWVLVGDPMTSIAAPKTPAPRPIEERPSPPGASVLREGDFCARGRERLWVRADRPRLDDATAAWEAARSRLGLYWNASASAARFERTLLTRYADTDADRERVVSLASLRFAIDTSLHTAGSTATTVFERGVWPTVFDEVLSSIGPLVRRYDEALATLVAHLVFAKGFAEAFEDGRSATLVSSGGLCPRCDLPLTTSRAIDPIFGAHCRMHTRCALCGPRESWDEEGPRVRVNVPTSVQAGATARVDVSLQPGSDPFVTAWIVAELKDKGRGEVVFSAQREVGMDGASFEIELPHSLTPDLHTLECVLVSGMRVAHMRVRTHGVG